MRRVFAVGSTVSRRYFRGPHISWAQSATVVSDDEHGLVLWLPEGADFASRVEPDGQPLRGIPDIEAYGAAALRTGFWQHTSVLLLHPPGAAHSVWWCFSGGIFSHWYVNLEALLARRTDGIDIVDHHLDIVVEPDRTWRWKDERDFAECTGVPGFWTADEARAIRDEGLRVVAMVQEGRFPFDGAWCDFCPDPSWMRPQLPSESLSPTREP